MSEIAPFLTIYLSMISIMVVLYLIFSPESIFNKKKRQQKPLKEKERQ